MRLSINPRLIALTAIVPAAIAWRALDPAITLQPNSRLWVEGTSNVRGYTCKAGAIDLQAEVAAPAAVRAVLAGEKAVKSVTLTVPVAQLDCGNGTMNDHMRGALKAAENPTIEFRLDGYQLTKGTDTVGTELTGTLTINGTRKPVTLAAFSTDAGNDMLRLTGMYEVHMKDYGVKPPTLMLGTMRVNEVAKVHFDLLLKS